MPLFLVLLSTDEGVSHDSFIVVEAPSEAAIAQYILDNPHRWERFLQSAVPYDPRLNQDFRSLWEILQAQRMTPEELLQLIRQTYADRHIGCQLRIYPIAVMPLAEAEIKP